MANKLNRDIERGEIVVIDKACHNENYQASEQRLFIVLGGLGMRSEANGCAVFGKYVSDGEECRIEGHTISPTETAEYQEKFGKFMRVNES
jgi:hypothetical protein